MWELLIVPVDFGQLCQAHEQRVGRGLASDVRLGADGEREEKRTYRGVAVKP
jgi:hypothetical protein